MKRIIFIAFCFSGLITSGCSTENRREKTEYSVADQIKIKQLLEKNTCFACHKQNEKLVGPSYTDIAKKNYSNERIVALIYKPEPENWPEYPAPMIALPHLDKDELMDIAQWINSLN